MVQRTSIAWKIALAFLLGAAVVFASPVMGAHAWAADPTPSLSASHSPGSMAARAPLRG
jgi:hypothetical protein